MSPPSEEQISGSGSGSDRGLGSLVPLPYHSLDEEATVTAVNDAWLETLGYERADVIGRPFRAFLEGDAKDSFDSMFERLAADGSISEGEFEMVKADGSTIEVAYDGRCEFDEAGNLRRTHCQIRDITDRKQTERTLRRQRDRFRALTGAIPDVVILYDAGGRVEDLVTGREELLVGDADDLRGQTIWETLNRSAATAIQDAIDRTLRTGSVSNTEYSLEIDGETHWFEGRVAPLETDEEEKVVFIARDITTRKEQERELRRTKERLELAVEGANLGVWDWDMQTDAVSRHAKLREMIGVTTDDMGGHLDDWAERVHPEGEERHERALADHIEGESTYYECDYRLRTGDGDWKWVRNIGKVVAWTDDGEPSRAVGIHIDIDEQKRTLQELARKTDQLEALNRIVRHDIRNDMNVIHGWAKELEDAVDESARPALRRVIDVSRHVMDLTTAAREFVDSLGGAEAVDLEPVDLEHHLRNEIEAQRDAYPNATFSVEGSLPQVTVRANGMVSAVFRNLLTNAVQHNPSQSPQVWIDVEERPDTVEVSIADDGPGIPDDRKPDVFGRAEKGLESDGTGIGLYLVHTLVESFGGEVWITDNEPEGAEFNVELEKAADFPPGN